jgi:type VII secretion protein EccE
MKNVPIDRERNLGTGTIRRHDDRKPFIATKHASQTNLGYPRPPAAVFATAAIAPQRALPIADLVVGQSLVAVGMLVVLTAELPRWYGAAAGLVAALVFMVPVGGSSVVRRTVDRLAFWWARRRRRRATQASGDEPFDAELPDGSTVGFRWDGATLMSLIRLDPDPQAMTVIEPTTVSGEVVPVALLGDCLRQVDLSLESIDVISHGARSADRGHIAATYDEVLGPLPAIAHRSVWVVVRLDPKRCLDAVRHRGGDWQAVERCAATATRRVANRLSDAGLRAQVMTAIDIIQATHQLALGVDPHALEETWSGCRRGRLRTRSFTLTPPLFTTAGLGRLWSVPSLSTTVCVTLRRDERSGLLMLRGLARFDGLRRPGVASRGLGDLRGRQFAALTCTLPVTSPRRSVDGWVYARSVGAIQDLELAASGCGQVVGADELGRAVALSLFGPQIERVEMCGPLHLAQQVVLRSVALGARVRVHTSRATAWRTMVQRVGDEDLLRLIDRSRAAMHAASDDYSVEVFDGTTEQDVRAGVTAVVVKPSHAAPSRTANVSLQVLDPGQDIVRIQTRTTSAVVTMVATDDELRYLADDDTTRVGASIEAARK